MTRRRYETVKDRQNESKALNLLLQKLGSRYSWDKKGNRKGLDAILYKDNVKHCLIEVKTRHPKFFRLAKSKGYILAKQKWDKLVKLDARLLVNWQEEGLYALRPAKLDVSHVTFATGGRTIQTRDEWDIEQMAIISWERFSLIKGK